MYEYAELLIGSSKEYSLLISDTSYIMTNIKLETWKCLGQRNATWSVFGSASSDVQPGIIREPESSYKPRRFRAIAVQTHFA